MREDASRTGRFLAQLLAALGWVWTHALLPLYRWLKKPSRWVWRQHRKLWALTVYRRNANRDLVFSRTRGGLFVIGTVVFYWYIFWPLTECFWQAGWYAVTAQRGEVVYLNSSTDLDQHTNLQSTSGCLHLVHGGCADDDTIYFRARWTWFNQIWSWSHLRGWWFFPEYVIAPVGNQMQACVVTSYGSRRRIFRVLDLYPEILRVSYCSPVNANEGEKQ